MVQARITVRNIELPAATEADLRERINGLSRYYERITSCAVTIDVPQRRRRSDGHKYRVRVEIVLPGGEIVINHQPCDELRTAVQDAFDAARRRLQAYVERQNALATAHAPSISSKQPS